MNILITAANSAAAYQLKNKLNSDNILMGDYLELPDVMLNTGKMIRLPNPSSASYNHQLLTLCLDKNIETVYILRKEEAMLLREAEQLFKEYNINLIYQ